MEYSIEGFWKFATERHGIYKRRFEWGLPPPWTADPVLADYRFCNVFRRLDYGTQWYLAAIVPASKDDFNNLFFKTAAYRMANDVRAFTAAGIPDYWDWEEKKESWLRTLSELAPINSAAYMTLGWKVKDFHTHHEKLVYYMDQLFLWLADKPYFLQNFLSISSPPQAHKFIASFPGLGQFSTLQIIRDLIDAGQLPKNWEDQWTFVGPGPRPFLEAIVDIGALSQEEMLAALKAIAADKRNFGLTLMDVQHTACEYRKYVRLSTPGVRAKKRRFEPTHADFYSK